MNTAYAEKHEALSEVPPKSETAFFRSALEALKAAAPEGSTVRAVGFVSTDIFLRAGYKVTEYDADVTIARGGHKEFALAQRSDTRRLILCPTHDYAFAAAEMYKTRDKAFAVMRRGIKPFAAAFDENDADDNLASVFGEIVSLDLEAIETAICAYMRGERPSSAAIETAKLLTSLTETLKPLEKNREAQKHAVITACRTAARIAEREPKLLCGSGASQAAEALRMLCEAESREIGMRGETETVLGAYITDFYIKCLTSFRAEFPPDNNKRIDRVCEYLGSDLKRACVYVSPIFSPQKMRLTEYRLGEFRTEILRLLAALSARQKAAFKVFKRLYPDDGYSIKTLVDTTDIGICVALAPDVFAADTLLSYLKQMGKLEKYIV